MAIDYTFKPHYKVEDLVEIMALLRSPGGCPWDAEQDHRTIKKNFIEETYEVVEAINKDDAGLLCEELGDVLLQVVFHARMEEEKNSFSFDDVADGICKKLIQRHPHVFGDVKVAGSEDVLTNWDAIKNTTKHRDTVTSSMESVPRELPALMRAEKLQHKASKVGFDWADISGALAKLREETEEFESAVARGDTAEMADELGDVLFSAVNAARFCKIDPEDALTGASDKFLRRFSLVEKLAAERGMDMKKSSLDELDKLWDEVKVNNA